MPFRYLLGAVLLLMATFALVAGRQGQHIADGWARTDATLQALATAQPLPGDVALHYPSESDTEWAPDRAVTPGELAAMLAAGPYRVIRPSVGEELLASVPRRHGKVFSMPGSVTELRTARGQAYTLVAWFESPQWAIEVWGQDERHLTGR